MRFQCLDVTCGKQFGWTAKKIVVHQELAGQKVTMEYVVCPYCGSLDFDEIPFSLAKPKPKSSTKSLPIVNMEHTAGTEQFDPADLIQHQSWKGKRIGQGEWERGSLAYGWDFKDQFKSETLRALAQSGGVLQIDQYNFKLNGGIVSAKKMKDK